MQTRILVVEDNSTNMKLMTYLLKAFGHTALEAHDGEEGMETARRELPDLILCDVQMPKMDGYEVAQRLKSHPTLHKIPLVAVTALAMVGDRDKVLAAGFDGYIAKPINPETFVGQVEAFLRSDERSTPRPPAPTSKVEPPPVKRATVFVVDNSSINLSLACSTLEPFGYEVILVKSAKEALIRARQTPPDLILSDLHMPDESSYNFIKAVKADPQLRPIPFVFISSTTWSEKDLPQGLTLGADKFILPPLDAQALLGEIETCLRKREK
jgi:two-component system cell cycle response regulator